jgi:hypothetical protein
LDRSWSEVFFLYDCANDRVVQCEVMKGGHRIDFLVCAFAQPLGDTPRHAMRREIETPPRDLGCQ